MILKAQVRTCELCGHKKKKKFPNPLDIEVTGPDMWLEFRKIRIFVFRVLKAQVRTCELRDHEKKKNDNFANPFDIDVTGPYLWRQFQKNQILSFYGLKGTGLDL